MTIALSRTSSMTLSFLASAGALAGAGLFYWFRKRARGHALSEAPAAAFAGTGAHVDSFVHTRDAGPDHIRDEDGDNWDGVDEASDASFPASDPPSTY
jgi:hypothetical protein